jgi:hypothetical protein
MNMRKATEIRVDFSLKREVFFVVIGALLGAISMLIPSLLKSQTNFTKPLSGSFGSGTFSNQGCCYAIILRSGCFRKLITSTIPVWIVLPMLSYVR